MMQMQRLLVLGYVSHEFMAFLFSVPDMSKLPQLLNPNPEG